MQTLTRCDNCSSTTFIVTERTVWRGQLQESFRDARHSQHELFLKFESAAVIDIQCAKCPAGYPRHRFARLHFES